MNSAQICIVDDMSDVADMCAEYLSEFYDVRVFYSAKKALTAFEEEGYQPDVVVTDIKMPGMDGHEFIEKLQARKKRSQVVIMTACSERNHLLQAIDCSVNGYIEKPFDLDILKAKIEKAKKKTIEEDHATRLLDIYEELSTCAIKLLDLYKEKFVIQSELDQRLSVLQEEARLLRKTSGGSLTTH